MDAVKAVPMLSNLSTAIRIEINKALAKCPKFVKKIQLFNDLEIEYLGAGNGMHCFLSRKTGSTFSIIAGKREICDYEIKRRAKAHEVKFFRTRQAVENAKGA